MDSSEEKIRTADELEFAVFCIESIAERLKMNAAQVYEKLANETVILNSYIIPEYEILHTQGKQYIVDDIIGLMRARGVKI